MIETDFQIPIALIYTPFILQGAVLFFDEFYFHHKRGLPSWEIWGHPLDTLTVLVCYVFVLCMPVTPTHIAIYFALSAFSCLFVTKDEFVHQTLCTGREMWLHALLFVLHPLCFLSAYLLWTKNSELKFLQVQTALISIFLLYQIFYWGLRAKQNRT